MITKKQLERRRNYVCASDAPAIVGVDLYGRTPKQIQASKLYQLDDKPNDAMARGALMEPVLLQYALGKIRAGRKYRSNIQRTRKCLMASLDMAVGDDEGIEAKLVGDHAVRELYGDAGTGEVPNAVKIQCMVQMHCAGLRRVHVVAAFSLHDWKMYVVDRDEAMLRDLVDILTGWHEKHVVHRVPVEDSEPMDWRTIKGLIREPRKAVRIPQDLIDEFTAAQAIFKTAETARDDAERRMLSALDDAEYGVGEREYVEYMLRNRAGYTVAPSQYRMRLIRPIEKLPKEIAYVEHASGSDTGRGSLTGGAGNGTDEGGATGGGANQPADIDSQGVPADVEQVAV